MCVNAVRRSTSNALSKVLPADTMPNIVSRRALLDGLFHKGLDQGDVWTSTWAGERQILSSGRLCGVCMTAPIVVRTVTG